MIEMPFSSPPGYAGAVPAPAEAGEALWFVFRGERLLVEAGELVAGRPGDDPRVFPRPAAARVPAAAAPSAFTLEPLRTLYLGVLGGLHCFAAEAAGDAAAPPGFGWHGLRALFSVLDDAHFALAGRALQLLEWDRTHQFCGRCGTPTVPKTTERSRECPACGLGAYPRVAPAIMALIRRGPDEVLLARSHRFPPGMYSALRLRRAGRDARAVPGARGRRGSRPAGRKRPLLRQPAVAVSTLPDDRLRRGLEKWRNPRRSA
jgi:NAD+ diphosphatase